MNEVIIKWLINAFDEFIIMDKTCLKTLRLISIAMGPEKKGSFDPVHFLYVVLFVQKVRHAFPYFSTLYKLT